MPIRSIIKKSNQFVLDLIFPPHCVSCNTASHWLCPNCLDQISLIVDAFCSNCGTPTPTDNSHLCLRCRSKSLKAIDGIRAAAHFEDTPIREAIHSLKYRNHRALAGILSELLVAAYARFNVEADIILPVPLHKLRIKERGYNQSELLARGVGDILNLPVNIRMLQRTRYTRVQVDLQARERYENVANAFSCRGQEVEGQKILLVDDVCTTGATLDACATALKQAGARSVWGLAVARASIPI